MISHNAWSLGTKPLAIAVAVTILAGCATPTATPTSPPAAAPTPTQAGPTPTKAPTATPTKRPIVKASAAITSESYSTLPIWVARGAGYLMEEGLDLDVTVTGGGAKALAAVVGRSVDWGGMAQGEVLRAAEQGQPVRILGALNIRGPEQVVLRKDVAERLGVSQKSSFSDKAKALKGLRIMIGPYGGSTSQVISVIMKSAGMDPDRDVDLISAEQSARVAAVQQGAADALVAAPPYPTVAIKEGYAIMLFDIPAGDLPQRGDGLAVTIAALESVIRSNPEVLEATLRAVWRAERLIHQDKEATLKAIMTSPVLSQTSLEDNRITLEALLPTVPREPIVTKKMFDDALNFISMVEEPIKVTYEQIVDNSIAEKAKRQLGF